ISFTDASRCFLSMLQVATTWQSDSLMKFSVLLGPCMPQPTTPIVMRSDGAGRPFAPRALAGMIVGAAMAAAVVVMNWRREILESDKEVFMRIILPHWQSPREQKTVLT